MTGRLLNVAQVAESLGLHPETVRTMARKAAGRPDLRPHDLRHTGVVLAAQTGATLAELMARLGHSTPAAAMRYQHAAADRDRLIADALSQLAALGETGTSSEGVHT